MNPRAGPEPSFPWREAALLFGLALLVRLAYLAFYSRSPFFASPILDSAFHDRLARAFAAGHPAAGAPYFRPPLYPWLLGTAYAVLGAGPWAGRILNAFLGSLAVVGVAAAAFRLGFSRRVRWVLGLAAALYAPELFLEGELLAAPLAAALTAWGLVFALAPAPPAADPADPDRASWIAASVLWSLAALARAPLALLPAGAALLGLGARRGRAWRAPAPLAVAAVIWLGPALIMASHGAGFRFPSTQGGINFYVGNHPGADGRGVSAPALGPVGGWRDFADASVRAASAARGRPLTPSEASSYWTGRGLDFWREHPGAALRVTAAKALYLFHGFETPNNRSLYEARRDVPWLAAILWKAPMAYWPSGLMFPLALVGAWSVRRRRRWRPVLLTAGLVLLPLIFFFVCARFRDPALAPLVLLAGAGAAALLRRRRAGLWIAFAAIYVLLNAPWAGAVRGDPARDALARGESALNAGRTAEAESAYRRALALDPREGRAELGLAVVAEREGDLPRALAGVERAARRLPDSWEVQAAWGRILERLGRSTDAVGHLEAAARDFPENPDLWGRLGLLQESLGRTDDARRDLERAAKTGSLDPEVWNSLGRFRRLAGDRAGALAAWNRALELDPANFKARFNRGLLHAEAGDRAEALEDLGRALAAAPDSASAALARRALALARSRLP
jgi:tetratricopeptide (TPR) repeat protein